MAAEQAVVGIDLGSSRFLVGVLRGSGVEVLVNGASYRATPTAIAFGEQRTTGDKATPVVRRDLENAIFGPTRFLGELTHQALQHEMNFNFGQTFFLTPGIVGLEVRLGAQKGSLRPEQLVASLFSEVMGVLQFNGVQPKEVVVSVPDAFGQIERLALLSAAKISGLPVAKLLNESSATALNYSVFRRNEFDGETGRVVGFVDVGHSKTTVSFAAVTSVQIEMLVVHANPTLGVRDLDLFLLQHYSRLLKDQFGVDVLQQKKLRFKLMEAIAKQRTALTINSDAPLTLECVDGDRDFTCLLKRDDLEKIGATFFNALKQTFEVAFAKLSRAQTKLLHSVERVGGGCRIPAVERLITTCFRVPQVSKTLDASESVVRGCVLQSAMLSPKFSVNHYRIIERLQYPVTVKLQFGQEEPKGQTLFEVGAEFSWRQSLVVSRPEQLTVGVCVPSKTNFEEKISNYAVIPARSPGQELTIYFLLDHNGLVSLENAVLRMTGGSGAPSQSAAVQPLTLNVVRPAELTAQEIDVYQKMEVGILRHELMIQEREEMRNRLESLIYATKADLKDQASAFGPGERAQLSQRVEQLETWLYGGGAASDKDTFQAEINSLQTQLALHSGRGASLDASAALGTKLSDMLAQTNEYFAQKWKSLTPKAIAEGQQATREAERLVAELAALQTRFSRQALMAFDFGKWTQEAERTLAALEGCGKAPLTLD